MDSKWVKGTVISIIVIPALVLGWKNIQSIWAAPDKLTSIEKRIEVADKTDEEMSQALSSISYQQKVQQEVSAVQIEALKEQMKLIAELKKKR